MGKDKLTDILAKHLVASVQMKNEYLDESNPKTYADRITRLTGTGAIFLQRGMYPEAYGCFIKSHINHVDDFWANFYLGSMTLEANEPAGANYFFRCCLEEAPEDWAGRPMVLTNYSSVQFKLGDFQGAESSLEEAINLNPDLDRPYYMGAIHHIYRKQYSEAQELIKRGLEKVSESRLLRHLDLDIQEIMENQ
ncbi:hypothetical protein JXB02_01685 [Candidatus Woesearchaeota archaeon]|nr:hypothetical protein [Candidatus Woesearchaeota archaeon]